MPKPMPANIRAIIEAYPKGKMTKNDLVAVLAERTGESKVASMRLVNEFLSVLSDSFCAGKSVELRGFGVFKIKQLKGHVGHNPQDMSPVHVPPAWKIAFRAGEPARKLVNKALSD